MPTFLPLCPDASLIVRIIVDAGSAVIEEMTVSWQSQARPLVAPSLLGYEVANALHRMRLTGTDSTIITDALNVFDAMSITFEDDPSLRRSAMGFADRFRLPATYDAHYLAVSERHAAEFQTCDRRLYRAVSAELPWVTLVDT